MAGLRSRGLGIVVNAAFTLDAETVARLAQQTADLLRSRGADVSETVTPVDLDASSAWPAETYGASTPEAEEALTLAAGHEGLRLEPVYTAKALAAVRDLGSGCPVLCSCCRPTARGGDVAQALSSSSRT